MTDTARQDLAEDVLCLRQKVDEHLAEIDKKLKILEEGIYQEPTPLWKQVFNQTEFYNGHGQLTLSEIKLSEVGKLLKGLEDNWDEDLNDMFYINMMMEKDLSWSGSVYQCTGGFGSQDKLWVSFDKIIIDTEESKDAE